MTQEHHLCGAPKADTCTLYIHNPRPQARECEYVCNRSVVCACAHENIPKFKSKESRSLWINQDIRNKSTGRCLLTCTLYSWDFLFRHQIMTELYIVFRSPLRCGLPPLSAFRCTAIGITKRKGERKRKGDHPLSLLRPAYSPVSAPSLSPSSPTTVQLGFFFNSSS